MNILGIYWGFCSGCSLFQKDTIVKAVSEERFSRQKNDDGFPIESLRYCLDGLETPPDAIAFASIENNYWYHLKRKSKWSIDDYIEEQHKLWYPKLIEGKNVDPKSYLTNKIDMEQFPTDYWSKSLDSPNPGADFDILRTNLAAKICNVPTEKIKIYEHHACHAYYAYYASCFRNEPVLVITIDGWGDGSNATINIFDENGQCKRVFQTAEANIGRIYRYITLLLGMKPNEHEYKVMGLAPYSKEIISKKAYEVFKSTLYVDGIDFKWNVKPSDSYFWFRDKLEGCRFDGIAAGLQRWVEELLTEWVRNAVKKFNLKKVILSGGVAMNIKANREIAELPELNDLFVPGAPSDESLMIGAAYASASENKNLNRKNIAPLKDLYLGQENTKEEEEMALKDIDINKFEIKADFKAYDIAKLLYEGKIVARCAGRMEFGARALCNRSIMADPLNLSVVPKINAAIKNRDFWMPFAPVIMDKYADDYLVNPKNTKSPFMTIGFKTTSQGWLSLPAGCHQADKSCRPQILTKGINAKVYEILEEFEKISTRGALLNTSFNLHGFPIVKTPAEAIYVFINSGLDALVLNNFLILKE